MKELYAEYRKFEMNRKNFAARVRKKLAEFLEIKEDDLTVHLSFNNSAFGDIEPISVVIRHTPTTRPNHVDEAYAVLVFDKDGTYLSSRGEDRGFLSFNSAAHYIFDLCGGVQ